MIISTFIVSESCKQYKYNGQEYHDELGLNLYDMDFRDYGPAIARWTGIDPVIHYNQSTYNSFDGNPVFWADPSGADSQTIYDFDGNAHNIIDNDLISVWKAGNINDSSSLEDVLGRYFPSTNSEGNYDGSIGGSKKTYNPSIYEVILRIMNGSTDLGKIINSTNDLMAALTGQARHRYGPDAIVYTKSVDFSYVISFSSSAGFIYINRGEHQGFNALGDYGEGIAIPGATTGLTAQGIYFTGEIGLKEPQTFAGLRFSGSISLSIGVSGGLNVTYAQTTGGVTYGLGISGGLGTPGVGAGIDMGNTVVRVGQ